MAWQDRARCRGMDTELFYPTVGEMVPAEVAAACDNCPVHTDCLEWALLRPEHHGVWAGTSEKRRIRLRRHRRRHGDRRALCRTCGTPFDKQHAQTVTCAACTVSPASQRRGA